MKAEYIMHLSDHPARRRLSAALDNLSVTFHGMTAHSDESNCDCHWGSAEELSLLKTPDVELEPDLLSRTWQAIDWMDHAAVLRRILPQFATALVAGHVEPLFGLEEAGYSFARGRWQQWPDEHGEPVREFLHAWWAQSLTDPNAAVPSTRSSRCVPRRPERSAPGLPTGRSRPATSATDVSPRRSRNGSASSWETVCRGALTGTSTTRRRCAPNWSPGSLVRPQCGP
ncbi:hypothetical protein ACIHAA_23000 [Streptomyces sp. NPDC052040]|uniref:hypothetical protein n=1 Tax=Streptomyces sp. NPDC052040 TaxID=3365682 RepID=UPI0037D2DD7D